MTRLLVAAGVLTALFGVCLQSRWDAACAAERPGTHWNADAWECM